jgi:LuxR family maltose regulon positive regulatory protein
MSQTELDSSLAGQAAVALDAPALAAPLVQRPRLVQILEEATAPVVLLNAPSGYGKSVLLAEWAAHDPRPFASIVLGDEHNDPALLLTSIIEALDSIEPVPPDLAAALSGPAPSIENVVLPRLGRALADRKVPLVLVLDDLEHIESPLSILAVSAVGGYLMPGSQLALATRVEPAFPIGRLRAHGDLTELGRRHLAMSRAEAELQLSGLGVAPAPKQLDSLVAHTEGWPAALYLAGLALREEPDVARAIAHFAGDDRIVVDYIREEFLAAVSKRRLEFLRRISVLDRLSGGLCDYVLGRRGSGSLLRDLSRSNMLMIPLDRRDEWFRFHPLFREMLRSEVHRTEPDEEAELNRRASDWWFEHGDWDRAINHAIEGEAYERAGELLFTMVPEYMTRGRNATMIRWLDRLGEDRIGSNPAISLTAAYADITRGAGSQAEHWAAVCRTLLLETEASDNKEALAAGLALAEACLARDGVEAMRGQTAVAAELLADDSPWLSVCCMLDGVGLHLRGLREEAHERLSEGARRGAVGAPNVQVLCLAQLALLAIEDDDWQLAEMLGSQARAQVERSGLGEYPMVALGVAVSALVAAHAGRVEKAAADLRLAGRLLGELDEFAPWYEVETRIVLARAAARLNDAPAAAAKLRDASRLLRLTPDATLLAEWIKETERTIDAVSASAITDLTTAELRVLQFLPTHLSFPQIADRIFVSPNTVKTQARSIYRKLGASSRQEAVERARVAGLLDLDGDLPPAPGQ